MSTITYLTSLVQQAIGRLNNYEANAKKVDELPHQTTLEPSSKIPVSRAGISEHLTVQQIISSIQNSNYNQLLAIGTISVSGTDITVPSGVSGQINGLLYGTSADTILSITLCPTGFSRKDIIVLTTANTVVVISGEETDGAIVLAPPVPTDAVYITEFDVNDTTIGTPIDPIMGTSFKKKTESTSFNDPTLSGADAVIDLQPNGQSVYAFSNAGLTSIDGLGLDLITGNPTAEVPYEGKDILIYNNKAGNLTLKHDGSGSADVKFLLEGGVDLVIPSGGKVWLKYGSANCEMIFKSWSDVDLSAQLLEDFINKSSKTSVEWLPLANSWQTSSVPTVTGTADNIAPNFSGNLFLKQFRRRYVSAATAGSSTSFRDASFRECSIGEGFICIQIFGNEDAANVSQARSFSGLIGGNAEIGNVNPSTVSNLIGASNDSGQANLHFINTAGSLSVDLGASFPSNTNSTDFYLLIMVNDKGVSNLKWRVVNLHSGADTGYSEITTGLPSTTLGLAPQIWRNNGSTALAVRNSVMLYKLIKL